MRALKKNTVKLWYVAPLDETEKVELKDEDGNYTGDFEFTFSNPELINISLYPTRGTIFRELYGMSGNFTYVSSTPINISKMGRLYKAKPTTATVENYDYLIVEKMESINGYSYGIEVKK